MQSCQHVQTHLPSLFQSVNDDSLKLGLKVASDEFLKSLNVFVKVTEESRFYSDNRRVACVQTPTVALVIAQAKRLIIEIIEADTTAIPLAP